MPRNAVDMHIAIFLLLLVGVQSVSTPYDDVSWVHLRGRGLKAAKAKCSATQIPGCVPSRRVARGQQCLCTQCAAAKGYVAGARSPTDRKAFMQCVCPPGLYEQGGSCQECEVGAVCPGGNPAARTAKDDRGTKTLCQVGFTTVGKRSTSTKDCVAIKQPVVQTSPDPSNTTTSSLTDPAKLPTVDGSGEGGSPGDSPSTSPDPAVTADSPSPSPSSSPSPVDRAALCTGDTYAAPPTNTLQTCIKCSKGLKAPPDFTGLHTDKVTVCHVPPGYYYTGLSARECPQGTYRDGFLRIDDPTARNCTRCPEGSTTETFGSTVIAQCILCVDGWGKIPGETAADAAEVCGRCNYGEWSNGGYLDTLSTGPSGAVTAANAGDEDLPPPTTAPGVSGACRVCPGTTFQHSVGSPFVSYGLTFSKGNTSPDTCVPRYSQLAPAAGVKLSIQDEKAFNLIEDGVSLKVCVQACPVDSCCITEFESDDGTGAASGTCRRAVLPPLGRGDMTKPALHYKLPPSTMMSGAIGDDGSSVAEGARRRLQSAGSGLYARCDMSAWGSLPADGYIGMSPNPAMVEAPTTTVEWNAPGCTDEASCKDACLFDAPCWGFMFVPGKGWALRGGEDGLGVRTFFVIPDPTKTLDPLDMEALKW